MTILADMQIEKVDFIKKIEDKSDTLMKRMRIIFTNGLQLSVVQGDFSYGGKDGLFEIAPMNSKGFKPDLFDDEDTGDDVCGYCDKEKVVKYINKIGHIIPEK